MRRAISARVAAAPELMSASTSPGDWPADGLYGGAPGGCAPEADGGGGGGIGEEGEEAAVTSTTLETARCTNKTFFVRHSAKVFANSSKKGLA
ncbi:hypothetical protein GCM10010400_56530 [Streptomyces aculeolatus]